MKVIKTMERRLNDLIPPMYNKVIDTTGWLNQLRADNYFNSALGK